MSFCVPDGVDKIPQLYDILFMEKIKCHLEVGPLQVVMAGTLIF